ncbi:MAG: cysteine peptidase family C39 domain-containing protein [Planctomycetota bacterium]|nr:cysteine peptidase family C39 domain-containing protein [Planctomycetota bacterium]
MSESTLCFALVLIGSIAAFFAGRWAGRNRRAAGPLVVTVSLSLLCAWGWLQWNPATLVRLLPLALLSNIEGVAGAPLVALILGVAWSRSRVTRQRAVVLAGAGVCFLYFIHGGFWMLQTTPASAFADQTHPRLSPVMQTQDFSCGPAAGATALRRLGIWTTEAELAELVQARPGSGTTMIRMLNGLSHRLESTNWEPRLVQPDWKGLKRQTMPALALTRPQSTRGHIIAIIAIRGEAALIADPVDGPMWLSQDQFMEIYAGEAIVFGRRPTFTPNDYKIPKTASVR